MFWILFAFTLVTFVVGQLLVPRPKGLGAANLNNVTPPTAQRGTPVPVVFGTCKIAPNVTWYGNVHADAIDERIKLNIFNEGKHVTTGYRYGADISGVLCHGPIDELLDILFLDTSMRRYNISNKNYVIKVFGLGSVPILVTPMLPDFPQTLPAGTGPVSYVFNAPDMFGGDQQQGGVVGKMQFFFGKTTQVASTVLAAKLGGPVSNYKGICHFVMYDATYGTSPFLQALYFIVRRNPQFVSPDAATANINGSANPADVIYEMMTNTLWGLGLSPAVFDVASFQATAVALKAEGMGVDFTFNTSDEVNNSVAEVLRHIDGVLFSHPQTGLLTLKLARADYDVTTLPHVTTKNATEFRNFKQLTWPQTINEVRVTYMQRGTLPNFTFVDDTVPAQNLANLQATGQISSTEYTYPYFSNPALALVAAYRELRAVSAPLASGELVLNRTFHTLTIGSVLILDWAPLGISGLVMRVLNLKFGTLESNAVVATVVEDVFASDPAIFTPPGATAWTIPTVTAVAPARALALPTPYFIIRADAFVGMNMVVRGNSSSIAWDGDYNNDPTVPDSPVSGALLTTDSPFCAAGTLTVLYPYTTAYQDEVGFSLNNIAELEGLLGTDAAGLTRGDCLAWIGTADGGEMIAWRDILPQSDGTYLIVGVLRGQCDTVPQDHQAGETVYFMFPTGYTAYFPGQEVAGSTPPTASSQTLSTSGYKLWPAVKGMVSSLPPGPPVAAIKPPATNTPVMDPRRAVFPVPVGNLRLNGTKNNVLNPLTPIPDSNSLTWVRRNRLTQTTTLAHDAADVTPEASETYEVEVRHVSRTTGLDIFGVLRTIAPATSPITYTNADFETDITIAAGGAISGVDVRRTGGGIRFLIRAVRSGLKAYDAALPGFNRKQLSGNPIIPSLQFANIVPVPGSLAIAGTSLIAAAGRVVASGPTLAGTSVITAAYVPNMDTTYLQAWYESDGTGNVVTSGALTTWKDLTGNGHDLSNTGANVVNAGQINGHPSIDFNIAGRYFSNLVIPLEGGMTYFIVVKYTALGGAYMNFYDDPSFTSKPILFADTANKLEVDTRQTLDKSAAWGTLVLHNYNPGTGKLGFKLRWNGAQIAADAGVLTPTGTVPGVVGTPANYTMQMFNRSGTLTFRGQIAAFGFYGRSLDGSEGALEAYLRAKYATW